MMIISRLNVHNRTLTTGYQIEDREKDESLAINLLELALKHKLGFTSYEDDYNQRVYLISSTSVEEIRKLKKQIEMIICDIICD